MDRHTKFMRRLDAVLQKPGRSNFHTHSTFCDGRDTLWELVEEAVRLGCPAIGFSGHSFFVLKDGTFGMTYEKAEAYRQCIREMQREYADRIEIFLGVEQDFYSDTPENEYEYVIGSVHYLRRGDEYAHVDGSRKQFEEHAARYYGGDYYAFAEDYYATVAQVYEKTKCDIIGHFDLITKFNEGNALFDTNHPRYRAAAEKALDALLDAPVIFEQNYGAIARGYRTQPYLEDWMLERIRAKGKLVLKTSDCHAKEKLLFGL